LGIAREDQVAVGFPGAHDAETQRAGTRRHEDAVSRTAPDSSQVRSDFDRIARLSADRSEPPGDYEAWLLQQAPGRIDLALDVGCGLGTFTRALARRSRHVTAVDLSPQMIDEARRLSRDHGNIEYLVADAMQHDLPASRFDCVASLAMLHHVPLGPMLARLRDAVAPGGTLLVLDLNDATGLANLPRNALAWPWSLIRRWGSPAPSSELARAWRDHGHHDTYPRFSDVKSLAESMLPGARVRRHLLWRYSIVWTRPGG
jgi:SAM-dependent methyltransferase